jgi:hypothetical protein
VFTIIKAVLGTVYVGKEVYLVYRTDRAMYLKLCLTSLDGQSYLWQRLLDFWSGVTVTELLCKLYNLSSVLLIVMLVSVFDRWSFRLIVSYPALFLSFLPFCQMLVGYCADLCCKHACTESHMLILLLSSYRLLRQLFHSSFIATRTITNETMSQFDKISRNDRLMCHEPLLAISILPNIWRNFCDLFSGSQLVELYPASPQYASNATFRVSKISSSSRLIQL